MIPFYALVVSYVIFRGLGLVGLSYFDQWQTPLQAAVAIMLLLTASAHWGAKKTDLVRMVPPIFKKAEWIVTLTGVLEIAGAIGILIPSTSKLASICLLVLLIAMFPANIRAARENLTIGGRPTPKLFVRSILHLVFLTAIFFAG
ncbi:DoxX family protein [Paenibacillus sp. N1-5-1-14]|uniref:DoxX family protein n=1 Tax=Paenibacillus radicibacter TaxID=2972488 RepID=UPI002159451B|nr:DoxX family protein [Paenibacillus radicibacter]MCR8644332.1 DoxX family protein [Paenibacillus radicibacter]